MGGALDGKRVLVVGRGSGIARAIADVALREGAEVIVAGRDPEALATAYAGVDRVVAERVDLTDDASIEALDAIEDVGEASLGLLTNGYITGMTLFVDGGERLV